jgi:hypothetical protein
VQVFVLEKEKKSKLSAHRLHVGRQGLQLAALIAAQLPERRDEAQEVLDYAVKIVREWLESDDELRPATALGRTSSMKPFQDTGRE